MKFFLCRSFAPLLLLGLPTAALADVTVDSTSIVRILKDNRPGFARKTLAPVTQFLTVDVDKLGDGNLSLHLSGWGRLDLAEKSYNNERADGSLTYGYAQYRFKDANAQVRAGRFFVREGILNEQVDGVSARTDLPYGFGISAFGGATVHTVNMPYENTDGKGDGIMGGRVNYRYKGMLELGLSGVYESDAPTLKNPDNVTLTAAGKYGSHRLIGGDVWFSPHRMVEVMGHTSYNAETERVAEHSYLLNIKPTRDLVLTGEFNEYRDRSLFYSSVIFANLVDNLNERSRTAGARASYELNKIVEINGDYKHYSRDIGDADRFGGDVRFTLLDNALRAGLGYHYLRSGANFAIYLSPNASGSFHEVRAYAMHNTKSYFASVDAIGYFFKEDINNRSNALEANASLGYHITPALALSGDISYGKNPEFIDDVKGLVRLTYNINFTGKGGTK